MKTFLELLKNTFKILGQNRSTLTPFAIVIAVNFCVLYLLYLAPQRPISVVLAPPIRAFFGESFLHYPKNIFVLPKIYHYASMIMLATFGVAMSGFAVGLISQASVGKKPDLSANFFLALKHYMSLLIIGICMFFVFFFFGKIMRDNQGFIAFAAYFVVILLHVVFMYAIATVITESRRAFSAMGRSLVMVKKYFIPTFTLVIGLGILYIPIIILRQKLPTFAGNSFPEIIIVSTCIGILFAIFIDIIITFITAQIVLKEA